MVLFSEERFYFRSSRHNTVYVVALLHPMFQHNIHEFEVVVEERWRPKPNKQGVWAAVRNTNNLTAYDLVADKGTETNVKNPILSVHSSQGNKIETVETAKHILFLMHGAGCYLFYKKTDIGNRTL